MSLSRLQNLLRSPRGTIIYVDVNAIDATDAITNTGTSPLVPFKSIQRAIVESVRISYQSGPKNDRFAATSIVINPGTYTLDNRPGLIPIGDNSFYKRTGELTTDLSPWDLTTNFDLSSDNNTLYKLNSIHGGIIIPRGTSLFALDLRKTKFRPTYVPNPENNNIERSAIFRVTGGSFFYGFSIFDANPNGFCYRDYTTNKFVPNFSHHKLTVFEYADGVNSININDAFLTYQSNLTDLDAYYAKIGVVYGESSGREIAPDFPSEVLDIEPVIDEYRIVGSRGKEVFISDIIAGDGTTSSNIITVTLSESIPELNVDTAIQVQGVGASGYDGQYVVSEIVSATVLRYRVQNPPINPNPGVTGSTLSLVVDTVNSASPYIFNCSLRSVYGMCGLHADGSKTDGFKSMVVAQYTGIGLQKDDRAFVLYDTNSGTYKDSQSTLNLSKNTRSRFKPEYENYHIKASNDSFIQLVSVFAIGYAQHFLAESGGDLSITNSNSNFGAKSLVASGFRNEAFLRDDCGYFTHIIPPKEINTNRLFIEYSSVDVAKTVGIGSTSRLYLYQKTSQIAPPETVVDGYRIGANKQDTLSYEFNGNEYSASIVMPNTEYSSTRAVSEKLFIVGKNALGINSISSNTLTLKENHTFINGESIRVLSDDGIVPDGIRNNNLYYAITTGVSGNQIKIAKTLNDAINANSISINNRGGTLSIVSRVSDKLVGEIGHPIQFDGSQWYVNVSGISTENNFYSSLVGFGTTTLGQATPRTYFTRIQDNRRAVDSIYRVRYVIPKTSDARPPLDGYVIQNSNGELETAEIQKLFTPGVSSLTTNIEGKNYNFIASANYSGGSATYTTELPNNLTVNSIVEINNVVSTANTTGSANNGYNGIFTVVGISSQKAFSVNLTSDPGTFTNNTSLRTSDLPYFKHKEYLDTYQIYKSEEVQPYVKDIQDGIYYLTLVNCSNSPSIAPFKSQKFTQPIKDLYPQLNRDNPASDPDSAASLAVSDPIGEVIINNPQKSLTKETITKIVADQNVSIGITNIISNSAGTAHTLYTKIDHGLNGISAVSISNAGSGYVPGNYYNVTLVSLGASTTGKNATLSVTVNGAGAISSVRIMDSGSAYGIGNTLGLSGVGTVGSGGVISVTNINSAENRTLNISGITENNYNGYYRISNIPVGKEKEIIVSSASSIQPAFTGVGLGITVASKATVIPTTKSIKVSSLVYSPITGLLTVSCEEPHGLEINNKVGIRGADAAFFNRDFIVSQVNKSVSLLTFVVDAGISTTTPVTTGDIYIYRPALSSKGGDVNTNNESRIVPFYAGISTTLNVTYDRSEDDSITNVSLSNAVTSGFKLGDYFIIDNEIFRVRSSIISDSVAVYRGQLGTKKETHLAGSSVRKLIIKPVELRRNSIIRASAHTNEYVGFGPGNYSTALPERQDRKLTAQEELLALSTKYNGGAVIYTAMSGDGSIYSNTKKTNGTTGEEEIINAPVRTTTGEEVNQNETNVGYNLLQPAEIVASRAITVEGGENNNITSRFDGPVIFSNKITSTDDQGIEAKAIFIQGDAKISREYSVGIATPTSAGNLGDFKFNANPNAGQYLGWVYANDNLWHRSGPISLDASTNSYSFDRIGIGTDVLNKSILRIGSGTSLVTVESNGVGIGTTTSDYRLNVLGETNIIGNLNVSGIITGNFNTDSFWKLDAVGIHTDTPIGINTVSAISGLSLYVNGRTKIDGNLNVTQIIEKATINTGILTSGITNIDLSNNNVHYFTSNATGNWTINFRGDSVTTLNDFLGVGESITVAIITTQGSPAYYNNVVRIDGNIIVPKYYGGAQIVSGNVNSIDMYTYVIIKTSANTFTVLYSQSQYG